MNADDFDRIIEQEYPRLVNFAASRVNPDDIYDVVHTMYVRARRGLADVRPDGARAWLWQVLVNTVRDHWSFKGNAVGKRVVDRTRPGADPWGGATTAQPDAVSLIHARRVMAGLTDAERDVAVLRGRGYRYAEIQAELNLTLPAVRGRLHRARERYLEGT